MTITPAQYRVLTWEILNHFNSLVKGGFKTDGEAIDYAIDANVWNYTVQPELTSLIRAGIVCGTCADEGIRKCNCYADLEDG